MNKKFFVIAAVLFLLSRFYILSFPPVNYSDVFHDYRRYANMWQSGLTPYLKHFYEYPPLSLPLLYLPLLVDNLHLGHYYQNYRFQIFLLDCLFFVFIFKAVKKLKVPLKQKILSLTFYLVAPMIAKDFFYEGLDWVFINVFVLAIIYQSKAFLSWLLFWMSSAIKLMTAPLLAVFVYLKNQSLITTAKNLFLSFLLVWGLPLIVFRSSLQVMFVFHNQRGIKYASFPGFVVETINYFTQTETRLNQPPDFQLQGPVSLWAEKIIGPVFYLSLLLVIGYALYKILKPFFGNLVITVKRLLLLKPISLKQLDPYVFSLKISLIFILTIFFTGKIFSQPFHLWYIPLITLFPFKNIKQQLSFIVLAFLLLVVDTTDWIRLNEQLMVLNPLPLKFFSYLFLRYVPMAVLLILTCKLPEK